MNIFVAVTGIFDLNKCMHIVALLHVNNEKKKEESKIVRKQKKNLCACIHV